MGRTLTGRVVTFIRGGTSGSQRERDMLEDLPQIEYIKDERVSRPGWYFHNGSSLRGPFATPEDALEGLKDLITGPSLHDIGRNSSRPRSR